MAPGYCGHAGLWPVADTRFKNRYLTLVAVNITDSSFINCGSQLQLRPRCSAARQRRRCKNERGLDGR